VRKGHWSRLGVWLAIIYIATVVAVYFLTALTTKPDDVGLDWIPFLMLSMPWWYVFTRLITPNSLLPAIPGFILNAGILYLLGMLIGNLWRHYAQEDGGQSIK